MPNFSATNLPTRPVEELRELKYQDMNSAELDKLRSEDFEAFKIVLEAVDGPATPPETPAEAPVPSAKRTIWRNGQPYEVPAPISYVNGIAQK